MKAAWVLVGIALVATPISAKKVLGVRLSKDKATARIIDDKGLPIGTAKFSLSKKSGLNVAVVVKGLSRGDKAIHLHTVGNCGGTKFDAAGGHWNPTAKQHGRDNPQGAHMGDMPNLLVGKSGRARLKFEIADGSIFGQGGLLDDDGASIVIHAQSDDHRTDPSGNSGDRVACGVIIKDNSL